jgi:hypothetical protein
MLPLAVELAAAAATASVMALGSADMLCPRDAGGQAFNSSDVVWKRLCSARRGCKVCYYNNQLFRARLWFII